MEIVQFKRSGGLVRIRITVKGPLVYRYFYDAYDNKFKGGDGGAKDVHELGSPANLELDPQAWSVRLSNVTGQDQPYVVEIDWEQATDAPDQWDKLDHWEKKGVIKPNFPVAVATGACMLMGVD